MKRILILFSLFFAFFAKSQKIEIPAEAYPFYSVVEWKGMGALLLNKDPEWVNKKINITCVNHESTSPFLQSFNPNTKDFHFVSSENARYIYFLDHLNPEAGKISLHQLNSAGNIKSTSVSISLAIKKLGDFDLTQLETMDVVTTDKALVYIFRYHDTKEKKYTEIATFITHHNLLVYATILGDVTETNLKDDKYGVWKYIGFTNDEIYFAARDYQEKKHGWAVKNFTSKAVLTNAQFINGPEKLFNYNQHVGIGTNGRTILKSSSERESGLLVQHNGKFYLTGLSSEGTSSKVQLKTLEEGKWIDLSSTTLPIESLKKSQEMGVYPLNEGLGLKVGSSSVFLPFDKSKKVVTGTYSPKLNTNPSRFFIEEKQELFAVSLGEKGILFFDPKQLNKAGNVTFELIKK